MSVSPSDFLASADSLAASGDKSEMTKRNVLSRAYYAAFHRAQEFAPAERNTGGGELGMHRRYFDQLLQNKKGSIERKIGEKLKSMYSRRLLADYHLHEDIAIDDVPVQLYSSRALFQLLDKSSSPVANAAAVISFPPKK